MFVDKWSRISKFSKLTTAGNFHRLVRFSFSECRMNSSNFKNSTTQIFWMQFSEFRDLWPYGNAPSSLSQFPALSLPTPPLRPPPVHCSSEQTKNTSWWSVSKRFGRLYILVVSFRYSDNHRQKHLEISMSCTFDELYSNMWKNKTIPKHKKNFSPSDWQHKILFLKQKKSYLGYVRIYHI